MKTLIYTFLALFISASIPVDAIASKRDRNDHRSTTYSENRTHDRPAKRHNVKKHRQHYRKVESRRPQHWRPRSHVKYIPTPVLRSYIIPSGYVYTSTPGMTLYFNW